MAPLLQHNKSLLGIKQELGSLPYLLSLLPSVFVIIGNLRGEYLTLLNIIFSAVLLPLADWLLPSNTQKVKSTSPLIPDSILLLAVMFHTISIASLAYGIYSGIVAGKWIWYAALSTGFNSGVLGINAAHELIHRKERWWQKVGIWNLFLVNYTHFYIAHRLGHHVWVGSLEDPATARYNESFYQFWWRTIPAQWKSALHLEAKRQIKYKKPPYGLQNFVVRSLVYQTGFMAILFFLLGSNVFWAYLLQSVLAFTLLEFVNYIEHYGLVRANGERVNVHHSWQSDAISSRFTLFELSRHTDHHMKASKPYYLLESHEESYVLPSGYFGMFYVGILPPLWFKMINPIIEPKDKHLIGQTE